MENLRALGVGKEISEISTDNHQQIHTI